MNEVAEIRAELIKKHCFAQLEKRKRAERRNTLPIDYDLSCVYIYPRGIIPFKDTKWFAPDAFDMPELMDIAAAFKIMGWSPPVTRIADNGEEYLRNDDLSDIISFFELAIKKEEKEKEKEKENEKKEQDKWGEGLDYIRFLFGREHDGLLRDQYGNLWFPTRNLNQMIPLLQNIGRWYNIEFTMTNRELTIYQVHYDLKVRRLLLMLIFPPELFIDRNEYNLSSSLLHAMLAAFDSVYDAYSEYEKTMEKMKIHKRSIDRLMVPDSALDPNNPGGAYDFSYIFPAEDPAEYPESWPLVILPDPVKTKSREYLTLTDEFSGFSRGNRLLQFINSSYSEKEEKEEKEK